MNLQRLLFVLLFVLLVLPQAAAAQKLTSIIQEGLCGQAEGGGDALATGQITAECVLIVLVHIIRVVFSLTGAICVLMLMIGGYQYALGSLTGTKDTALQTIRWAIIGLIASVFSFAIVSFVISALTL